MMKAFKIGALFLLLSLLPACGNNLVGHGDPDGASTDTDTDVDTDTATDADTDTDTDTAMDGGSDAGEDVGQDPGELVEQEPVPLGSCFEFAILASSEITNIPTSTIVGDVGLTPDSGGNISGFAMPAICPEVTGTIYTVDVAGPACSVMDPTLLLDAKSDAEIAFIDARAAARGTPISISGNLDGLTLYPGLYESGSSLEISPGGILYLDALGDENAVFIIRSATSITTESTSQVVLAGDAKASNVFWTAGSTVTLGTNSIMKGTLIAGTSISLLTGASLEGRALNQGASAGAITLDQSTITVPSL